MQLLLSPQSTLQKHMRLKNSMVVCFALSLPPPLLPQHFTACSLLFSRPGTSHTTTHLPPPRSGTRPNADTTNLDSFTPFLSYFHTHNQPTQLSLLQQS